LILADKIFRYIAEEESRRITTIIAAVAQISTNAEECDARDDDSSNAAGFKKNKLTVTKFFITREETNTNIKEYLEHRRAEK
jgi:hypothetical protein